MDSSNPPFGQFISNVRVVDPDQRPRSAASDLGFHCLPMSFLWVCVGVGVGGGG